MLITLLASLYISILCWGWGYLLIRSFLLLTNQHYDTIPAFSITCITGLSILATIAGLCSLFMPLGGITIQAILLLPVVLLLTMNSHARTALETQFRGFFSRSDIWIGLLFLISAVTVLIMNAWVINHPDTLVYHLQTKKWIEEYKAVPGIVNLDAHYGYQGMWYVLCALFSFKFIQGNAPTFINSTIVLWYILFITNEISHSVRAKTPHKKLAAVLYIFLFAISALDYGQMRLTCTSLSPDFVAGLYTWLILYLVLKGFGNTMDILSPAMVIFLSITAITLKLSAVAVSIFICYAYYQLYIAHKKKVILYLIIFSIVTFSPFIARNVISSGYVFFPSVFPDVVHCDWKLPKESTILEKNYISAFAKSAPVSGKENIEAVLRLHLTEWIPTWWNNRSYIEKIYLSPLPVLLILGLLMAVRIIRTEPYQKFFICYVGSVAGIILWFNVAPDPRFAYGFLIPVQGICIYYWLEKKTILFTHYGKMIATGLAVFTVVITMYAIYRCIYNFKAEYILHPAGVANVPYRQLNCNGLKINIPINAECRNLPLPCANGCGTFLPRGKDITSGFKSLVNIR